MDLRWTSAVHLSGILRAMKKTSNLATALLLATALSVSAAGCYGSYGAFNGVKKWNGSVSGNKWARSGIHLALWIIPVYPLAIVGDFLIFNTVEHFTGDNPF